MHCSIIIMNYTTHTHVNYNYITIILTVIDYELFSFNKSEVGIAMKRSHIVKYSHSIPLSKFRGWVRNIIKNLL